VEAQFISEVLHDRYCLKSLLGRQTGRRTFLAIDDQTDRQVVVKLLLFGVDFDWDDFKLFEREAAVLKSLDHPAIPQYLDYFDVETPLGKGFALVQTYLEAKSLQDLIQSGRTFSETELKQIAQELLRVLQYLHGRQPAVVHRDLKPSNILLGDRTAHSSGQIYLVDFGSVQAGRHEGTRTVVGTYGYMPPEQFGGKTSPASDLYALGATLIYMATGQHPADLPQRDLRIRFEDYVTLSPHLVNWLQCMTEPSLQKRPKSAHQSLKSLTATSFETSALNSVSQPHGSKVRLINTGEMFEFVIPPGDSFAGWSSSIFLTIGFYSVILYMSSLLGFLANPAGGTWLVTLLICMCVSTIWFILSTLAVQMRFRITGSEISVIREIADWQVSRDTGDQQHLSKIELLALYRKNDSDGTQYTVPPQLNIWAGNKVFRLGGALTPPEQEWLAQEIATWLDMPVSRWG
jgi:serine/threonine protein kinase